MCPTVDQACRKSSYYFTETLTGNELYWNYDSNSLIWCNHKCLGVTRQDHVIISKWFSSQYGCGWWRFQECYFLGVSFVECTAAVASSSASSAFVWGFVQVCWRYCVGAGGEPSRCLSVYFSCSSFDLSLQYVGGAHQHAGGE